MNDYQDVQNVLLVNVTDVTVPNLCYHFIHYPLKVVGTVGVVSDPRFWALSHVCNEMLCARDKGLNARCRNPGSTKETHKFSLSNCHAFSCFFMLFLSFSCSLLLSFFLGPWSFVLRPWSLALGFRSLFLASCSFLLSSTPGRPRPPSTSLLPPIAFSHSFILITSEPCHSAWPSQSLSRHGSGLYKARRLQDQI